jgi:S1-C subfamily serine protease
MGQQPCKGKREKWVFSFGAAAAAAAGVAAASGDIVVGMDTRPIRSTADLIAALDERRPGDKVTTSCNVLLW